MVTQYSAPRALAELDAQHTMLRGMMTRCEALADELDAGRCGPEQLTREVTRLRLAFEAHNRFEEQMLRPVLFAGVDPALIDRKIEEHVDAHRALRVGLSATETETAALRDVIVTMRAHIEAEERFIVSASLVRAPSAD